MKVNENKADQSHSGSGDNVNRDKYEFHKHLPESNNLLVALKEFEDEFSGNDEAVQFIEELADYLKDYPGREVVGLENKLKQANMDAMYSEAVVLKQRFTKRLYRGTLSLTTQQLYAQTLALVNTYFSHKVKPLLASGASYQVIQDALLEEVFLPVFSNTARIDTSLTIDHIRGMLYFLTGKCHTKWS